MKTYRLCFLLLAMLMAMPLTVNAEFVGASSSDSVSVETIVIPADNGAINLDSIREAEIDSLTKVAEQGSVEAQKKLGRIYRYKDYDKQDYKEALKWYHKAAEQGDVESQFVLGGFYRHGGFSEYDEAKQDYVEAAKWYRKAAEQGDAGAQLRLGELYAAGEGVKQDYVEAAKWFRKAAEQGDARAQEELGALYAIGKGVKKDYNEALKWYHKAADNRYNEGYDGYVDYSYIEDCEILGDLYAHTHDYTESAKWYRKAVDNLKEKDYGFFNSQLKLGLCYAFGKGVEQNFSAATGLIYSYFNKEFKSVISVIEEEDSKVVVYIIGSLLLLLFILLFISEFKKNKKRYGLAKKITLTLALSALFCVTMCCFLSLCLIILLTFIGIGVPLITSDLLMFCSLILLLIILFIGLIILPLFFYAIAKKTTNANSASSEGENETSEENSLMDGKKGHKVRFNRSSANILGIAILLLAFLVGIPYYWFVTKAVGYEPLPFLRAFHDEDIQMLFVFIVALILGLIAAPLLQRLVWGWRNTSYRMDRKKGVIVFGTYFSKPIKKSKYIIGVLIPFFILGLLPWLVSPFVNSFTTCLFGIVLIFVTSSSLFDVWELSKEPRDCMIHIKGSAIFVLDEEQPADNE